MPWFKFTAVKQKKDGKVYKNKSFTVIKGQAQKSFVKLHSLVMLNHVRTCLQTGGTVVTLKEGID